MNDTTGSSQPQTITDWGDAPPKIKIFGRQIDLDELTTLQKDGTQVICLYGAGGIGKSTLARNWSSESISNYETIVWVSFKNRPNISNTIKRIHQDLLPSIPVPLLDVDEQISEVVGLLESKKAVIILDNLESIMRVSDKPGILIDEFLPIERFVKRFAEKKSNSVILLTTRELPIFINDLSRDMPTECKHKKISGLDADAVAELADKLKINWTSRKALEDFTLHHGGSPYAISLTAPTIKSDYHSNIDEYAKAGFPLPTELMLLIEQQISRLKELERVILYRLTVERVAITLGSLQISLGHRYKAVEVNIAVEHLRQRSLLEPSGEMGLLYIQNVLSDYATEDMRNEIANNISKLLNCNGNLKGIDPLLRDVPIIIAMASREIREAQLRVLVKPILDNIRLAYRVSNDRLATALYNVARSTGTLNPSDSGYVTGTLITLLIQIKNSLNELDLSELRLWSCDFEYTDLIDTNFSGSDLSFSRFREVLSTVNAVLFGAKSEYLYFGTSDGIVHSLDIGTQSHKAKKIHSGYIRGMAYDRYENTIFTVGVDGTFHELDAMTLSDRKEPIKEKDVPLRFIVLSEDGKRKIWGGSRSLIVMSDSKGVQRFFGTSSDTFRGACFVGDDDIAIACESGTIKYGAFGANPDKMQSVLLQDESLWCIASTSEYILTGGQQGILRQFDKELKKVGPIFEQANSPIWGIVVSKDYYIVAISRGDLLFYDKLNGSIQHRLPAHTNWIRSLAIDTSGRFIVSGSQDQSVHVYDESSRALIYDLEGASLDFRTVVDTEKHLVAGGTDGLLHYWHNDKAKRVRRSCDSWIRSVAYSTVLDRVVIGDSTGLIELWHPDTGKFEYVGVHPGGDVWSLDCHPKLEQLVSAGEDGKILEWKKDDLGNWSPSIIHDYDKWAIAVKYSPDGRWIASGDDKGRTVLSSATEKREFPYKSTADQAWGLAWCANGQELVVAERGLKVHIWSNLFSTSPKAISFESLASNWSAAAFAMGNVAAIVGEAGNFSRIGKKGIEQNKKVSTNCLCAIVAGHDKKSFVVAGYDGTVLRLSQDGLLQKKYIPDRQYSRLNLTDAIGLSELQRSSIAQLGGLL